MTPLPVLSPVFSPPCPGMDASNLAAIRRAVQHWAGKHPVPANYGDKVGWASGSLRDC